LVRVRRAVWLAATRTGGVGGTSVKIAASNQGELRKFASGPTMTVRQMVSGVKNLAPDWNDRVSIGYPGVVKHNQPVTEPHNLAPLD
jgi:polyphosphate glucokinase